MHDWRHAGLDLLGSAEQSETAAETELACSKECSYVACYLNVTWLQAVLHPSRRLVVLFLICDAELYYAPYCPSCLQVCAYRDAAAGNQVKGEARICHQLAELRDFCCVW